MVVRTHPCVRCGDDVDPGHVYSAVDVLDAEGELHVILCRECGSELREFLAGEG
ncbi:hypothetical protein ACFQJD_16215 [Haloplanus sp. GCM10025708]|uniref:hypothetical protein n=1 Tax=Haloferacaceae TaxID=1644056 RepID=UPI0036152E5C